MYGTLVHLVLTGTRPTRTTSGRRRSRDFRPFSRRKGSFMHKLLRIFMIVAVVGLAFSAMHAQEKKINRNQLPAAVEKTVAAESAGATIKGFATEVEDGQKFYEAS